MIADFQLIEKLYARCGPILQYRIATELMDKNWNETEELRKLVLSHPEVQRYIEYYAYGAKQGMARSYFYPKMIHGSKPEQLENTVGKLWTLGLRKGFPVIDQYFEVYKAVMEYDFYRNDVRRVGYGIYQIAQLLGILGYAGEENIFSILQARLDQLYNFVQQDRYDIYVDIKDYPNPPANWKDVDRIIDPSLTRYGDAEGEPPLPSVYDVLGMIGMKQVGLSEENTKKVDAILRYCYDERYQHCIMHGYGILLSANRQYYAMGWSIHLPGYGQQINENINMKQLLLWADLLSHFEIFKELQFFEELLIFLEKYKDKDGFYLFPNEFIPEDKVGYFVLGKHMGLGENRRQKEANANESTFRVLKIKKNIGLL